jgi:hypothetical protein
MILIFLNHQSMSFHPVSLVLQLYCFSDSSSFQFCKNWGKGHIWLRLRKVIYVS